MAGAAALLPSPPRILICCPPRSIAGAPVEVRFWVLLLSAEMKFRRQRLEATAECEANPFFGSDQPRPLFVECLFCTRRTRGTGMPTGSTPPFGRTSLPLRASLSNRPLEKETENRINSPCVCFPFLFSKNSSPNTLADLLSLAEQLACRSFFRRKRRVARGGRNSRILCVQNVWDVLMYMLLTDAAVATIGC